MDIVMTIIISVLLGLIPEVTYFTLFLKYTKNLKEKVWGLGILIGIAYILCMFIQRYKVIYYILFIVLVYLILKLLYRKKVQIIDIFTFSISTIYLTLVSFIFSRFIGANLENYYICLILSRVLLFLPIVVLRGKMNDFYKQYYKLWNRNYDKKQPIKSITLRNVSLFVLNIFIFIMNIISVSMTNLVK